MPTPGGGPATGGPDGDAQRIDREAAEHHRLRRLQLTPRDQAAGVLRRDQGPLRPRAATCASATGRPAPSSYTSELDGELAKYEVDPYSTESDPAGADHRRGRGPVHRRRLLGAADLGPAARARRREHPHRRARRRRRRHLVLEPLPGCRLRRRRLRLPAAARRDELRAEPATTPRGRRSSPTARRSPSATTCTISPCSRPRSPPPCGTSDEQLWHISTDRGDTHDGPLRRLRQRHARPSRSWRGSRAWRRSRATPSTRRAGTTTTPAPNLEQPRRQGRRDHRHRRQRRADRAQPRRRGEGALRLPAHAVGDRRPRRLGDRPGVGGHAASRAGRPSGGRRRSSSCRR